ncbi:MAG: 30S ribosomal protein S12 methylthiotransferase RimO [Solobacterium sp.]|nr:30S ribosomal protein S12 methylthiotransferase RimO [Solobacterium sp.]
MKIGIISLGCAKNLVDTENLLGMLKESGQEAVTSWHDADAVIINTCGFIESAKSEAIETILDAADYKEKGLKKLIVMGCLSQRYKPQLEKEMPEVDRFIAIDEYRDLGKILSEVLGVHIANNYGKAERVLSGKPWMAYLRIADGCDNRCSYCAIPLIRGPLRSYPEDEIIAEAKRLVSKGVRELNLIAQDCSRYGYDWDGQLHLSHLLKRLDALEGVHWIRILYLYPDEIPDDLIETIRQSRHILPYFDIPVQHGSDKMLKAMHRRGSSAEILERCMKIRSEFDHAVLRTTLITGFPGETIEDHEQNLALLKKIRWDHLGVFTYSREEGTPGFELGETVDEEEKERRKIELMDAQIAIASEDRAKMTGTSAEVLVESRDPLTGMYIGRSALYAPDGIDGCVRFRTDEDLYPGDIVTVEYTRSAGQNLIGRQVKGH